MQLVCNSSLKLHSPTDEQWCLPLSRDCRIQPMWVWACLNDWQAHANQTLVPELNPLHLSHWIYQHCTQDQLHHEQIAANANSLCCNLVCIHICYAAWFSRIMFLSMQHRTDIRYCGEWRGQSRLQDKLNSTRAFFATHKDQSKGRPVTHIQNTLVGSHQHYIPHEPLRLHLLDG